MYAIFMTGGKQYKVSAGDVLRIEKIQGDAGDKVKLDNVIAFSDADGSLKIGTPYLDATVNATIVDAGRGEKVIIFKFKAKKDYRRKQGHRQPFTEIEVDGFTVDGKKLGEKPPKPKEEKEEKKEEPVEEAVQAEEKKPAKQKAAKKAKAEAVEEPKVEAIEEPGDEAAEVPEPEEVKKEKPVKAKAPKADKAEKAEEPAEEKPAKAKAPKAEKAEAPAEEKPVKAKAPKAEKAGKAETKAEEEDLTKLTKAELTAKLDEIGVKYLKSAKKEDLIELLTSAGK